MRARALAPAFGGGGATDDDLGRPRGITTGRPRRLPDAIGVLTAYDIGVQMAYGNGALTAYGNGVMRACRRRLGIRAAL
ncbi:hypothetical protein ACH41H_00230 [Streptomyces sp. NPDC020800]|uniref:hypothetical protein n=1 Tax=Streptomyces sp. NPDC020800 TaxID=3365092 RepID=UPI0037B84862